MSDPVSESLKALLRRDGITREGLAGPVARGMGKAGSRHEAASRQVVTDIPREEDTRHRPLLGSVSPGKLRLVWDMPKRGPTRPKASEMPPLGVGPRLRMIVGGKV